MALLLFGLEAWVATVLWAALVLGWYASRRVWWRMALTFTTTLALFIPWLLALGVITAFYWPQPWESPGILFGFTLFVTLIVAVVYVWYRGLRREPATLLGGAITWPLGRLALAAIVATVLAQGTLWMFDAQTRENLTDLRREAQVLVEAVAPRPLLDADNAAPLYYRAFDAFGANYNPQQNWENQAQRALDEQKRPKLDSAPEEPGVPDLRTHYWDDVVEKLSDEVKPGELSYDLKSPRLRALLERNRHIRELLIRATKLPGCNFDRDYTRPAYDMALPEVVELRSAARYLAVDARHAAAIGNGARAAEDIRAIYGLADHCTQEPWIVCLVVAVALDEVANQSLRAILAENPTQPREILDFAWPEQRPFLRLFDRSLRGEEATAMMSVAQMDFDIKSIQQLIDDGNQQSLLAVYAAPLVRVCFLDWTAADMRASFRELRDLNWRLRQPSQAILQQIEAMSLDKRHTPLVRALIPAVGSCSKAALRGDTHRRQIRVALALYRYYHAPGENGEPRRRFPETLAELAPEYLDYVPSDPCSSGQPLKYRRTDQGCLVYGLGYNLTDDGGVSDPQHPDKEDLVYECFAPQPLAPAAEPAAVPSP